MKIIDLRTYRIVKDQRPHVQAYKHQLETMSKSNLLTELIRYDERYRSNPMDLRATLKGQALMDVLESRAELTELKDLSRDFKKKLGLRLHAQLEAINGRTPPPAIPKANGLVPPRHPFSRPPAKPPAGPDGTPRG